jgi:hypothetical protein
MLAKLHNIASSSRLLKPTANLPSKKQGIEGLEAPKALNVTPSFPSVAEPVSRYRFAPADKTFRLIPPHPLSLPSNIHPLGSRHDSYSTSVLRSDGLLWCAHAENLAS